MSITAEAKKEVEDLLFQGQRLKAIKYLCDTFQISLHEAKMLVEAVEKEMPAQDNTSPLQNIATGLSGEQREEVIKLLRAGKKLEAVKTVKKTLRIGLKEALNTVEEIQKEVSPDGKTVSVASGCLGGVFTLVSGIFGLVGILMLGIAGYIYYSQSKTIENSDLITGIVTELKRTSSGTAPVIAYQWQGTQKVYRSSTYSTPPAYAINEQVSMFVNRNDPNDVIVDTFSDRWLLIVILGTIGGLFTIFTLIFIFVSRKF